MDLLAIRIQKAVRNIGTGELAARAGVSRCQTWRWQTGRPHVAPETAAKLERVLLSGNSVGPDSRTDAA